MGKVIIVLGADGLPVAEGTPTPNGGVHLIEDGTIHHPHQRARLVVGEGDAHAEMGNAGGKVGRPVERINIPTITRFFDWATLPPAFFAHKMMRWKQG